MWQKLRPSPTHSTVVLILLAFTVLFYSPLLLGLRTFPDGDFTHHFLPFSLFHGRGLYDGFGALLWNPYTFSGHPFLADTQAAVFYPINLLVLVLSQPFDWLFESAAASRLYFLQVEAIIHVAMAGVFVYLFVHDITKVRSAGLLAGITFAFCGYLTGYPPLQLAILRSAVWLPLILYLLRRAFHDPYQSGRWLGFVLAAVCAFMAGHPQTMLYIVYVVGLWCLLLLFQARHTLWPEAGSENAVPSASRTRLVTICSVGASVMAIVGLCAVQLFPSLEFAQMSVRASTDYDFVSGGLSIRDTWQILLPRAFTWFSPLYIGVCGLGLAFGALNVFRSSSLRRSLRSVVLFWCCVVALALLISYGRNGFLYKYMYQYLPGWSLFRQQERAAYLVTLGLSILAGIGFAELRLLQARGRRLYFLVYALVVAVALCLFGWRWQLAGETTLSAQQFLVTALLTLGVALVLYRVFARDGWDSLRTGLIVLVTIANLFAVNMSTNLSPFGPVRKTILSPEVTAVTEHVVAAAEEEGQHVAGRVYNEFRIYDDYGIRHHVEDVGGSSPLKLANYAALFDQFPLDRMWQLTGVEYVLTWRRELFEPSVLIGEFPQVTDTTYLHRLLDPNPRAWMVSGVVGEDDEEVIRQLLADHQFDVKSKALITPSEAGSLTIEAAAEPAAVDPERVRIELLRLESNRLRVEVSSDAGGFLVISENFVPGLSVQNLVCNRSNTPCTNVEQPEGLPPLFRLFRTNLSFVGLTVPSGTAQFELVYWPATFFVGAWVSAITALLLIAGMIARRVASAKPRR